MLYRTARHVFSPTRFSRSIRTSSASIISLNESVPHVNFLLFSRTPQIQIATKSPRTINGPLEIRIQSQHNHPISSQQKRLFDRKTSHRWVLRRGLPQLPIPTEAGKECPDRTHQPSRSQKTSRSCIILAESTPSPATAKPYFNPPQSTFLLGKQSAITSRATISDVYWVDACFARKVPTCRHLRRSPESPPQRNRESVPNHSR